MPLNQNPSRAASAGGRWRARAGVVGALLAVTGVAMIVGPRGASAQGGGQGGQGRGGAYSNNFDLLPREGWTEPRLTTSPSGESFLGPYDNEATELAITGLNEHTHLVLAVDLLVIGPWGDTVPPGLESMQTWSLRVDDNDATLDSSFSNLRGEGPGADLPGVLQSYPDMAGGRVHDATRGSFTTNTLGYTIRGESDTTYRLIVTAKHSGPVAKIRFAGAGLRAGAHRWGIDNLHVFTYTMNPSEEGVDADVMGPGTVADFALRGFVAPGTNPESPYGNPPKRGGGGGGGGGPPGGGGGGGPPPPFMSVPAPGPAALIAAGALMMARRERRRK